MLYKVCSPFLVDFTVLLQEMLWGSFRSCCEIRCKLTNELWDPNYASFDINNVCKYRLRWLMKLVYIVIWSHPHTSKLIRYFIDKVINTHCKSIYLTNFLTNFGKFPSEVMPWKITIYHVLITLTKVKKVDIKNRLASCLYLWLQIIFPLLVDANCNKHANITVILAGVMLSVLFALFWIIVMQILLLSILILHFTPNKFSAMYMYIDVVLYILPTRHYHENLIGRASFHHLFLLFFWLCTAFYLASKKEKQFASRDRHAKKHTLVLWLAE